MDSGNKCMYTFWCCGTCDRHVSNLILESVDGILLVPQHDCGRLAKISKKITQFCSRKTHISKSPLVTVMIRRDSIYTNPRASIQQQPHYTCRYLSEQRLPKMNTHTHILHVIQIEWKRVIHSILQFPSPSKSMHYSLCLSRFLLFLLKYSIKYQFRRCQGQMEVIHPRRRFRWSNNLCKFSAFTSKY